MTGNEYFLGAKVQKHCLKSNLTVSLLARKDKTIEHQLSFSPLAVMFCTHVKSMIHATE